MFQQNQAFQQNNQVSAKSSFSKPRTVAAKQFQQKYRTCRRVNRSSKVLYRTLDFKEIKSLCFFLPRNTPFSANLQELAVAFVLKPISTVCTSYEEDKFE
jgi:hypothetical protein